MLSWRKLFLAVMTLLALARGVPAASDWQIVKIGGREYLTVENIAKFYGFPTGGTPVEKRIRIDSGTNSVEFQLDSREVMINGVRSWLCFPVMEKDGKYLVSRVDLAKTLEPQLRPQMILNLGQFKTVVLDPGHGGYDKGATSGYGCEKDFALDVARDIKPLLEAKRINVKMTRNSDLVTAVEDSLKAPSVHNTQPWRWRFGRNDAELHADRGRQLTGTDPEGRDLMLSCGAALHHLRVALAARGLGCTVDLQPDPGDGDHLATVTPTSGPADPIAAALYGQVVARY